MASGNETTIVRATAEDISTIQAMVIAAYSKYVDRMGTLPAPMLANYSQLLDTEDVYVLRSAVENQVLGSIILAADEGSGGSIKVNNLVVDPSAQGRGYGRILMNYAEREALSRGLSAVSLFTNVKMVENIGMYAKLGFIETDRRIEGPYERVYFRKHLANVHR
ncbi:hypothetical protein JX265_011507 [Neoarthrinium moseri]|uniref:N-acetyltransferase domain-containing protein n=1 Tax=Neoarthrinium moseri TaxID=1658444 RepID=A0A9P9WC37_9PEZI|nr:hypothetical protein JX266_005499 [Neoarthrinium moseri]KAI1856548.1 hypothetical protein JX265_011507 [Neoarthrinium moseri]